MILREQEKVFLFELGLIVPPVLNVYFDIICTDVVYPPGAKSSLFSALSRFWEVVRVGGQGWG